MSASLSGDSTNGAKNFESFQTLISVTNSLLQLSAILLTAFLALVAGVLGTSGADPNQIFSVPMIATVTCFSIAIISSILILLRCISDIDSGAASIWTLYYRISYIAILVALLVAIACSGIFLLQVPKLIPSG